jgi:glutamate transport system substrate-binding protein
MKRYAGMKVAAAMVMALAVASCGDDTSTAEENVDVEVADDATFDSGTTMANLSEAGKIVIGVKKDQPGIGFQQAGDETPTGFDIEIGRMIAAALGIEDADIEWKETISDNREPFLDSGEVDIVVASYSMTPDRQKIVGQAGPYYVTGQQLLVREEDKEKITGPEDLEGVKVCSVEGSTSLATAEDKYGADPTPQGTYSECVSALENGTTDVLTTDGAILLGYEAQNPDELEVVGEPFSEERYGVGYQKPDDTEFCEFITSTLQKPWTTAPGRRPSRRRSASPASRHPEPPQMDPCM